MRPCHSQGLTDGCKNNMVKLSLCHVPVSSKLFQFIVLTTARPLRARGRIVIHSIFCAPAFHVQGVTLYQYIPFPIDDIVFTDSKYSLWIRDKKQRIDYVARPKASVRASFFSPPNSSTSLNLEESSSSLANNCLISSSTWQRDVELF